MTAWERAQLSCSSCLITAQDYLRNQSTSITLSLPNPQPRPGKSFVSMQVHEMLSTTTALCIETNKGRYFGSCGICNCLGYNSKCRISTRSFLSHFDPLLSLNLLRSCIQVKVCATLHFRTLQLSFFCSVQRRGRIGVKCTRNQLFTRLWPTD